MSQKRSLEDWERAECAALKELVEAYNNARPRQERITQEAAGAALGITQGAFSNYLNARIALNKEIAAGISRLFGIPVEKFSQRLAAEIADMAKVVAPAATPEPARHGQARRASLLVALATPRSQEALERIARAANEGRLTEADLILLEQIASRFERSAGTDSEQPPPANGNQRLKERLRNNDPGTQR